MSSRQSWQKSWHIFVKTKKNQLFTSFCSLAKYSAQWSLGEGSAPNFRHMRGFCLALPIRDAVRRELRWTHYRLLLRADKSRRQMTDEHIASRVGRNRESHCCGKGKAQRGLERAGLEPPALNSATQLPRRLPTADLNAFRTGASPGAILRPDMSSFLRRRLHHGL